VRNRISILSLLVGFVFTPFSAISAEPKVFESRCVYLAEGLVTIDEPCTIKILPPRNWEYIEEWTRGSNRINVARNDGMLFFGAELAEELEGYELTGIEDSICYRVQINRRPRTFCRGPIGSQ